MEQPTLEELDLLYQMFQEENKPEIERLRAQARKTIATFDWVDEKYILGLSKSKLRGLWNRHYKVQHCGKFMTYFDPNTGGYRSFKMVCEDFTVCSKCAVRKAEQETKALSKAIDDGVYKTIIPNEDYDKLRNAASKSEDMNIFRRYQQSDGTTIIFTSYAINEESQFSEEVNFSEILTGLLKMQRGSRISGSVKSAPIVERKQKEEKKEVVKTVNEEPETEESEEDLLEFLEHYNDENPDDTRNIFHKLYHFNLQCSDEISKEIVYEALKQTYLDTYKLDPTLETVQMAINDRQEAYARNIVRVCESRNISYNTTNITKVTTVVRKNLNWKQYFEDNILVQFELIDDLTAFFT